MTHRFTNRLSEYIDGDLSPEDARRMEDHLRDCELCTRVLEELRGVVARASRVTDREVSDDVWPGIATRIQAVTPASSAERPAAPTAAIGAGTVIPTRRRRIALSIPQLAAAAILLVALAGGTAWLAGSGVLHEASLTRAEDESGAGALGAIAVADADPRSASTAVRYAIAIDEMERALFDPGTLLPASTEAKIRKSLRTIDRAIDDARRALEEVPTDGYVRQHLAATLRLKVDFLRRTTRLVAQS